MGILNNIPKFYILLSPKMMMLKKILGGVCDYCHLGFHSPKNLSAHLLATHGLPVMRAASADLATTSAAANAALGDVHAVDEDEINGTNLQKSESAFFGVLKRM